MRRIATSLVFFLLLANLTHAQSLRFTCESGERYDSQLEIIPPEISLDAFSQYIVTIVGLGRYNPVSTVELPGASQFCNVGFEQQSLYQFDLPDLPAVPDFANSTQEFVSFEGRNIVQIGEEANNNGEFLVIIEGIFDFQSGSSHTFSIPLTEEILNSDVSPMAYLFALSPEFGPTLSLTGGEGETIEATPLEDYSVASEFGEVETASAVSLAEMTGTVELTVDSNDSEGFYVLMLHVKTGEAAPGDGIAQVAAADDGTLTLLCNDAVVSENATQVTLPDDGETYTVTAVGLTSFDPIMALVDRDGQGVCYNDVEAGLDYAANLPTITANESIFSSQVVAAGDARTVVVGSPGNDSGEYIIIVEGGSVPVDDGDVFGLYVTPAMINISDVVTGYAIAADEMLNPVLSYVDRTGEVVLDDDDEAYQCDDAGIPDNCYGTSTSLRDYDLTLADGQALIALEVDSFLQVPINDTLTGATFWWQVTGSSETEGAYVLVFHVVTE